MPEDYYIRDLGLPESEIAQDDFKAQDPFNKAWNDLKGLSGLEKNFKRRTDRMSKAYDVQVPKNLDTSNPVYLDSALAINSGMGGATSKEINPGTVYRNGYGMFDVITPPWNLYELANFYDTSFANHASIDAKVQNTVGLGYDFHVSDRTLMLLESNENDSAREKARRRIERIKMEMRDLSLIHI